MTEPTIAPPVAPPAALPAPSPTAVPNGQASTTPLWASATAFGVLALLLAWFAMRGGGDGSRLAVIEAELRAGQTRLAALEQRPVPDVASVTTRLASLEAGVQVSESSALERRLALLEQRLVPPRIDVAGAVEPMLTPIAVRVAALEHRPAPDIAGPVAASIAPLVTRIETLERKPAPDIAGPVSSVSGALGARIDALDAKFTKALAEASARVTTAARLRAVFQALEAGKPLGEVAGSPSALAKFAALAPPTEASLRLRFPEAAAAAEQASKPTGEGQDFTQRMLARAQTLVTVRQGDHVLIGAPAAVTLAAARVKLDAGDLAGAIAALAPLDGAAAAAISAWRNDAQALLDARAALTELAKS